MRVWKRWSIATERQAQEPGYSRVTAWSETAERRRHGIVGSPTLTQQRAFP